MQKTIYIPNAEKWEEIVSRAGRLKMSVSAYLVQCHEVATDQSWIGVVNPNLSPTQPRVPTASDNTIPFKGGLSKADQASGTRLKNA